ncbi:hypothetical protein BgiMline_023249 [Biomphalaria glabrata]|nr:hypothetical protein BgiMline_011042 [Biomphalaria glabrata]
MLSRKGTISRKNRASMRRGRGRGGTGVVGGLAGGGSIAVSASQGPRSPTVLPPKSPTGRSPILMTPSSPGHGSSRSCSSKDVSFAPTVESCSYALDSVPHPALSDAFDNRSFSSADLKSDTSMRDNSTYLTPDCNISMHCDTSFKNLTSGDQLVFNYQSMARRKVSNSVLFCVIGFGLQDA